MKCNSCSHKRICKHYQYFATNFLTIKDLDCDDYLERFITFESKTTALPAQKPIQRPFRFYPDLSEEEKHVNTFNVEPVKIQEVQCERCKRMVPSTEVENCKTCGRAVCQDCLVTTVEDGNVEFHCESCWSNTPDPDFEDTGEPVVIFGAEEKDPWDIEAFESKKDKNKAELQEKEESKVEEDNKEDGAKEKNGRRTTKKSKK